MPRKRAQTIYPPDYFSISPPRRPSPEAPAVSEPRLQEPRLRISPRAFPRLMTLEEVAQELRRYKKDGTPNVSSVYKLIRARKLRGTKDGRQWKVRDDHYLEYLERGSSNVA